MGLTARRSGIGGSLHEAPDGQVAVVVVDLHELARKLRTEQHGDPRRGIGRSRSLDELAAIAGQTERYIEASQRQQRQCLDRCTRLAPRRP